MSGDEEEIAQTPAVNQVQEDDVSQISNDDASIDMLEADANQQQQPKVTDFFQRIPSLP